MMAISAARGIMMMEFCPGKAHGSDGEKASIPCTDFFLCYRLAGLGYSLFLFLSKGTLIFHFLLSRLRIVSDESDEVLQGTIEAFCSCMDKDEMIDRVFI